MREPVKVIVLGLLGGAAAEVGRLLVERVEERRRRRRAARESEQLLERVLEIEDRLAALQAEVALVRKVERELLRTVTEAADGPNDSEGADAVQRPLFKVVADEPLTPHTAGP